MFSIFQYLELKNNYERVFNTHTELHVADGEHRWQTVHISPPSVCEVESFEANAGYLAHGALWVNVSTYMKNTVASVWCGLSGPTFQGDFCVITLFAFGMWRPCCCFLFLAHSRSRRAKFFHWMTEGQHTQHSETLQGLYVWFSCILMIFTFYSHYTEQSNQEDLLFSIWIQTIQQFKYTSNTQWPQSVFGH